MARTGYWLTPPTRLTLIVSLVLVILALRVHYACFDTRSRRPRFRDASDRLSGSARGQPVPRTLVPHPLFKTRFHHAEARQGVVRQRTTSIFVVFRGQQCDGCG